MIELPWYAKWFLALGGAGLLWKGVDLSLPKAAGWLRSWLVHAVGVACHKALANPNVKAAVVGNRERLLPLLRKVKDALIDIVAACEAEVEKDIEEAANQLPDEPPKAA